MVRISALPVLSETCLQSLLETAPDRIREGHFITGLALAAIDVWLNGLTFQNVDYFSRIWDLFDSRRLLFVQIHKLTCSEEPRTAKVKVFYPQSMEGQKVIWQGLSVNTTFTRGNHGEISVSVGRGKACEIKICSIIDNRYVNQCDGLNLLLEENVRSSFTSSISAKMKTLKDLYDFVNFFGTYGENHQLLPIQSILLNPFNIDCSEFSTMALELLKDKGIAARYALGVSFPRSLNPKVSGHCWIKANIQGKEIDIDPSAGRKIGKIAYGGKLPFTIFMGTVDTLDEVSSFPISVVSLNKNGEPTVKMRSSYVIYKLFGGKKNGKKRPEGSKEGR